MEFPGGRLSVKLVWVAVGLLVVGLAAIGYTLLESWKLEGGAAVINDMGSERMRSYRIAYLLAEAQRDPAGGATEALPTEMDRLEAVLDVLKRGDPARPLAMPRDPAILSALHAVEQQWHERIRPSVDRVLAERDLASRSALMTRLRPEVESFVALIDSVVGAVERQNARHTELLRYMQLGLVALAIVGTVALVYLMFLLVVRPVETLWQGMQRMTQGDFAVRLPVETRDEFGELATGFNRMAAHLEDLYTTLEGRVASKTRSLEEKNRELAMLYDVATLLNTPAPVEALCRTFLQKLRTSLGADAGAVRLVDPRARTIHLYVHEGLDPNFARNEQCLQMGECFCGISAERGASAVEPMTRPEGGEVRYPCAQAGFATVSIFPIRHRGELLGIFNLFFRSERTVATEERRMLEMLGDNLAVAIESQRLISRVKEMAAADERTLLAQELHDSIAQSLAFLNIEAQMLDGALTSKDMAEARDILSQMRVGIQSSYDDVRELLVHFRTRVKTEDLALTIRNVLERFEAQTGIRAHFTESGSAVPLPPEQHVQVLHILQEALSNVRKHSGAAQVRVRMHRDRTYSFAVEDDGRGFDVAGIGERGGHIGLNIMRERAQRIGGELEVRSRPAAGTTITLKLPVTQREAA
jgi:two-component system nitrate/nitrite sensor histidine kinase NarX